jgi:hypothetical protein
MRNSDRARRLREQAQNGEPVLREFFTMGALWAALATPLPGPLGISQGQAAETNVESGPIVCKVIEVFEEPKLGVRVVLFHQRGKTDGPRLGSLLLEHSGKEVILETPGGGHFQPIVFRVKSCFGRGLMLIPAGRLKLEKNDQFTIRLP